MAGPQATLFVSRWTTKVADTSPPSPPSQPVSQFRGNTADASRLEEEDGIVWDEDDSEMEQEPETAMQWESSSLEQSDMEEDDEIQWDESSSEEGVISNFEATEEITNLAVEPSSKAAPLLEAHVDDFPAPKDPYIFVTRKFPSSKANNLILKHWQENPLQKSRWATSSEKEGPKPTPTISPSAAPSVPTAPYRPSHNGIPQGGAFPIQPVYFKQPQVLPNIIHIPPFPVYVPPQLHAPSSGFAYQQHVAPPPMAFAPAISRPMFPQPLPAPPRADAPSPLKPTFLDYPMDPAISSLICQTLGEFCHLVKPRNAQIERDGNDFPEANHFKSQSLSAEEIVARNKELQSHAKHIQKSMANTRAGTDIKKNKAEMTINQHRQRILQLFVNNAVVVIAGATGSGKTTQLPQIILEDAIDSGHGAECNIFVTQPRRVAAVSVARRVRKERFDGNLGSVGFHVKFDAQPPKPGGSITYCTTGILLNRIQRRPDEVFENISHIIVDEVHERDMIIDRLLALLKWQLFTRKSKGLRFPKIILSSATLDIDLFTKYFAQPIKQHGLQPCPFLDIPGRMFPVEYRYLGDILSDLQQYPPAQRFFMDKDRATIRFLELEKERKDMCGHPVPLPPATDEDNALIPASLIALTVAHIVRTTPEGAILVFLPGLDSIKKVQNQLELNSPMIGVDFTDTHRFRIIILHSDMKEAQDEAFDTMRKGCRKIVLSTNIAETSVTIPDAVYVVDSGKHKEKVYDPHRGLSQLRCGWVSKSSCKQRAGRSGRIRNGYYFAMYSKQRAGMLRDTTLPEILRSDLQEVCLQLAHQPFEISVRAFLDRLIEAPDYKAVDASLSALKDIDALTDDEQITSLGRVLASLPVHPALAKMIVLGIIFRCLDPMLILASATNIKDMFLRPLEARTEAKAARMRFSGESNSDHLALINAFDQARSYGEKNGAERCRRWLRQNFISFNLWREVYKTAEQMEQILIDRRLIKYNDVGGNYWKFGPVELNENATNEHLIKALIIAGFHPNVAATHGGPMMRTLHTDRGLMTNHSINVANMAKAIRGQLYTFSEMTKSPDGMTYTVRDNSTISPLMPIIFGRDIKPIQDRQLLVDGWLQFRLPTSVHRTMLIQFKTVVDNVLADSYNQLGSASRQIANDPLREKLSRYLGQLLFMDVKTYEQWLETQPPIPKSPKNKRKKNNRKNKNRQA